jgi:biopolymer transport protein ExbD
MRALAVWVGLVALASAAGLVSACAEDEAAPPPPVAARGAVPGAQDDPAPGVIGTPSAESCEPLGRRVGTSLRAKYLGGVQSVDFPLTNRPVPSRLAILAVGTASALSGKTVALGAADNGNYRTCTHCVVVALGCGADCSTAAWFYPRSGSATFTAVAEAGGQAFNGKLTNVILEEVKVDPQTKTSSAVAGGACLHVQELSFESITGSTPKNDDGSSGSTDQVPEAEATEKLEEARKDVLHVFVESDGGIYINDVRYTTDQVSNVIAPMYAENTRMVVMLRSDRDVSYVQIDQILSELQAAGAVRVSFYTNLEQRMTRERR